MTFGTLRAFAFGVSLALAGGASAQEYPTAPIRWIVPYGAGGSTDVISRVIADKLGTALGQPVVVENIPGAGGRVGTEALSDAEADGYSIGLASPGSMSIPGALVADLQYDPESDFTMISPLAIYYSVLVAAPDSPFSTVGELIEYGKANPGSLSFGSAGIGSSTHILGELFRSAAGIDLVHIPFNSGAGDMIQSVAGSHTPLGIISIAGAKSFIEANQVKPIAMFSAERYPDFPDVPAMSEELEGFVSPIAWYGLVAPAGIPNDVTALLNAKVNEVLTDGEVAGQLKNLGIEVFGGTPEDLATILRDDIAAIKRASDAAGGIVLE